MQFYNKYIEIDNQIDSDEYKNTIEKIIPT